MALVYAAITLLALTLLAFLAWRQYLWAARHPSGAQADTCPYSLRDVFGQNHLANVPHQKGVHWLSEVFSRSAKRFPDLIALQIPHTGDALTFAELDARAESVAAAIAPYLSRPDQVVAVAMSQDNPEIVAAHLGILKAGGTLMFLDTTLPDALIEHMLDDAQPVLVLTRGEAAFRDMPTLDLLNLPENLPRRQPPTWLDDPTQRLATIFYTSGTTGLPKGVECAHAGYVNLALTYADYFDLVPGMDATSLTSSLGYDGSISEMYSAWVSGCTVVMLTKEQVRSGPDLVPVLRDAEVTVLFCPPVLLTTLTAQPEVDLPYPICRYIVPAGEAFPTALVEPWTRGRRQIINTYGPTEASTDTSRQTLRPDEPITIGSPFPNVTYVILEVDELTPLPHGEVGELCIGGVHVARGYRNLPEQTAKRFIDHPQFGRLYRSGDKCRIDIKTQRVHFLGRIDAQLKVRGHRVEAQAVEDMLHAQFTEIEAAVLDYQNDALVAFVSAPSVAEGTIDKVAPAPAAWAAQVTAKLAKQLPEPSVPSMIFLVEGFVMKPVSGKIDRKCLPKLSQRLTDPAEKGEARHTIAQRAGPAVVAEADGPAEPDLDPKSEDILAICRDVIGTQLGPDDGFAEAGAHSIVIARLAQRLQADGWPVTVRALLSDSNTVRKVASRGRQQQQAAPTPTQTADASRQIAQRDQPAAEVLPVGYFTLLQILFAFFLYSPALLVFLGLFGFVEVGSFFASADLWAFIAVGFGLYGLGLIAPFATLFWVLAVKLLLGGHMYKNNVTPGVYPKWSKMHLRIWCISRLENLVLLTLGAMYRSAPLMAFTLRQLGAQVGANLQCAHDAALAGPLDLLCIEDDVAIQTGAYVQTTRWSGQFLQVGAVHLESRCKIGMRAAIAPEARIGSESWITPFTPILGDVGRNEMWEGAPARLQGGYTELKRTARTSRYNAPVWLLETANILMQVTVFFALTVVPTAVILWIGRGFIPAAEAELSGAGFTAYVPSGNLEIPANYFSVTPLHEIMWHLASYAFATAWISAVVTSMLTCLFVRYTATAPGLYPSRGLKCALLMYRMKLMNGIQTVWTWTITGQYLRALAGMRFPRVGASECDVLFNLVPDLTTADSQIFWSNGSFTNMLDYGSEHIKLRHIDMPRNFFSGNNCVAEHGHFPANFLLGVSTPGNDIVFRRQMRARHGEPITVAGNPPVKFASASFEEENETHRLPSFSLFLGRVMLNDFFSIGMLRITEGLIFTLLYICLLRLGGNAIASAVLALILTEGCLIVTCVALKRVLVGNDWGRDHQTPFWSWRHFTYFFTQDCFFIWCKGPLNLVAGTILANPILRWMGCRVGARTLVNEPLQGSDWNAVDFGRDCVINGFLQFHTFENMTLKVKRARIGDGCAVSFGATVMGGANLAKDATLLPVSLVLKEMQIASGVYEGSPAEPSTRVLEPAHVLVTSRAADVRQSDGETEPGQETHVTALAASKDPAQ